MNRALFFDSVRHSVFSGSFTQKQTDGLDTLIDAWEASYPDEDPRRFAYCLATAYHETAATMQPIAEYGTNARAEKLYGPNGSNPSRAKRMGNSQPGDGAKYKGRGYVQLTWKKNYIKAGKALGVDMVSNPKLAMVPAHAARILFEGCLAGWFTGKKLSNYIDGETDYRNARRVVNGTDKASLIAGYAEKFEMALEKAAASGPEVPKSPAPDLPPPPDIPNPPKPKPAPVRPARGFWAWFFGLFR